MRKSFWIVLALFVVISAPVAHADSFSVTFTNSFPGPPPTALDVTFPSPTLDITWQGVDFTVIFPSAFQPGDAYTWFVNGITCSLPPSSCSTSFVITDLTHFGDALSSMTPVPATFTLGVGTLTFTAVTAPEPSSLALIPIGLGAILMMRKRMGHSRPSVI